MKKIITTLGLAADADEGAIVTAIASLQASTSVTAIATALGLETSATAEQVATAATEAKAKADNPAMIVNDVKPIAAALGAADDSTIEQLATAAAALKAGTIDPTRFVPIETHQALIGKVAQHAEERATASVDAAIQSGKISPANRDWGLDYFKKDEAGFTRFVASAPEIVKAGEEDTDVAALSDKLTDEEKDICSRMGLSEESYLETKKELA